MRFIAALTLLGVCAVAVSAAPDACAPAFNWFPTAAEIGQDVVVNNKTCTGKQVCNFPRVWTKNNQTAYMPQLGTGLSNGLLKVAFKQYGNQPPRLFFTPVSEFLEVGADVSACLAARSQPPTTRKLLAGAKVVKAGTWSYTVSYDGGKPTTGVKIAGQSGELDPRKLILDGDHCAEITLTVSDFAVSTQGRSVPDSVSNTQKVCWFKVSKQPTAKFDFDMCTNKKFTVNVSNLHPLSVPLTQNGSLVRVDGNQEMLFRPVIHLFGNKNKTLDGKILKDLEYDNLNNPVNFINKYIVLPKNFTSDDVLSFILDKDELDEGYYKLSAKIAMMTRFPDLVELEGENRIVQADAYGEDVRGFTEFLGVTIVNETDMVGVQRSKTTISEISSDRDGMGIEQGDAITFSWHFVGIGKERCFHDGVELPECESPMRVTANDVSSADTTHTFQVKFVDVCGEKKTVDYKYTQRGVTPVSKVDYQPVATTTLAAKATAAKSAASVTAPMGLAAAIGAAVLMFLLL